MSVKAEPLLDELANAVAHEDRNYIIEAQRRIKNARINFSICLNGLDDDYTFFLIEALKVFKNKRLAEAANG